MNSIFRLLTIALLTAPGPATGQETVGPNEEQLKILRSGVQAWNTWRAENPEVRIDLKGADLTNVYLSGDYFSRANFGGADLSGANLSGANLRYANLSSAKLAQTSFVKADLGDAILSRSDLSGANLDGANFSGAHFGEANLDGADLNGADLSGAKLTDVKLTRATLTDTNLSRALLEGSDLRFSNLTGARFEPISMPAARAFVGSTGLSTFRVVANKTSDNSLGYDIGAIANLRKSANEAGLIAMERDLTCAMERIRNRDPGRPWYARIIYYVAFDLTCDFGADPGRPFFLLLFSALAFALIYAILIKYSPSSQLRVDFLPNHEGDDMSGLLYPRRFPVKTRHKGRLANVIKYSRL